MELVVLAVLLELGLVLIHLLRRRALVVVAEQSQDRARKVCRVVDGGHRLLLREVVLARHHAAAPALHHRVEALGAAGGQEGVTPARAGAPDPHLAVVVGKRAQVVHGADAVPHHLVVGHASVGAHLGRHVFRRAVAGAEVEVGRDGGEAVVRQPAGGFTVPLVPAGQVVDGHHSGERPLAQRTCVVSVDGVAVGADDGDGLRQHPLVLVGLVHGCLLGICSSAIPERRRPTPGPVPPPADRANTKAHRNSTPRPAPRIKRVLRLRFATLRTNGVDWNGGNRPVFP